MESSDQENLIARYLLGELPEADADALEVRLLAETDFADEMQAVEYELIDRYVRNQLHAAERQRFETHYLATPLHRERVATARELLLAADEFTVAMPARETYATVATERVAWWQALFATPAFAWSSGVALALLGAMVIWLLLERGRLQSQLQAQQLRLQTMETELAQQRSTVEQLLAQTKPSPTPATSEISLNDGGALLAIDAQGQLRGADGFSEQEQSWLRQTLQAARLPATPGWMDIRVPRDELMGTTTEPGFALQQPLGISLLSATPKFQWKALPEAESYRVDVYDLKFQLVISSGNLTQTSWQASRALASGQVYQWQVTALRQGQEVQAPTPPAPPARFAIVAANEAAAIEQAKRRQPAAHLLLSALYARNGLHAEAERELLLLQKANPASSQVKQMLAEVRRRARQSAPTKTKPAQ